MRNQQKPEENSCLDCEKPAGLVDYGKKSSKRYDRKARCASCTAIRYANEVQSSQANS